MAKKSKNHEQNEERLTKVVRDSAQQIWQAGLGAFTDLQHRTRELAGDKVDHVRATVNTLEQVFEERVTRALESIGVPMRKDVDALIARVEELSRQVDRLSAAQAPVAARPKAAKAAVKVAAKPAAKKVAKAAAPKKTAKPAAKAAAKAAGKPIAAKKAGSSRKTAA